MLKSRRSFAFAVMVLAADIIGAAPAFAVLGIYGTGGDDHLVGTAHGERIEARAGDDSITAGAGGDVARGGYGNDVLRMGPGNDFGNAGTGNNRVYGGRGSDHIWVKRGYRNLLVGGAGHDILESVYDGRFTTSRAGAGRDEVYAGSGIVRIYLGEGPDYAHLVADQSTDHVNCGDGHDRVTYTGEPDEADTFVDCESVAGGDISSSHPAP